MLLDVVAVLFAITVETSMLSQQLKISQDEVQQKK